MPWGWFIVRPLAQYTATRLWRFDLLSQLHCCACCRSRSLTSWRFDILLVRFALERLLFRLSLSAYSDNYILKGGMLVTQWLDHDNRETRDADFLGFGETDAEAIKAIFAEITMIKLWLNLWLNKFS